MIKCKFCGAESPVGTRFCPSCGAKLEETPVVEAVVNNYSSVTPNSPRKRNPVKGGILAWSIVNTVLGMAGCCTFLPFVSAVLGIIAIVFTVLAQDCQDVKEEKSKIKVAVILNVIASAIVILSMLLLIALLIMDGLQPYPYTTNFDIDSFMEMYPYMD